jgi:hypothetical protein
VILEGTFSDDMITTGMFLRDDDSCKIRGKGIKKYISLSSTTTV